MAKRIIDEEMRFSIIINGDPAQKELHEVQKATEDLVRSNQKLRTEKERLERQNKTETARYKEVTAEMDKNTASIQKNYKRMDVLEKQIGVTGLTMQQLSKKATQLRTAITRMSPKDPNRAILIAELERVNAQLSKVSLRSRAAGSALSKLSAGFNKYAAIGASAIATVTGLVISFQKLTDIHGKLSDAQSDVQKTTGLTKKAIADITAQLGLFKTRTARIELLKLAEEAGRLGKDSVEDVMAFVRVGEQLKIALGDELNTTQIRSVGKMVEIYKVGAKEGLNFENAMLALGSSINEVSASGANTADYLVDFLGRTAGVSDVANIAAQDMVGLAAAFDEAQVSQEISATAINKFFGSAANDVSKFAKVAGVSVKEYSDMLNKDANQALIAFLKGLKKGDPEFLQLEKRLNGIELGGTRGSQAIKALAANIDKLEARQKTANTALKEGTSLTDEAALKNNNLAATVEKIKNRLTNWFTSAEISEGLNNFVVWIGKFIGAVEDGDGKVTVWRNRLIALIKTIIIVTAALVSYRTAVQLVALWTGTLDATSKLYIITQRIQALTTNVLRTGSLLLSAAYALLTGNLVRARAAMVLLNASMLLSPIGLIVGAVAAAGAAYYLFSKGAKEATTSQSLYNDSLKEAQRNIIEQVSNKKQLLKIARDEKISLEERQKAVDELNRIVPEYNNNLTIQTANTLQATQALEDHIEALKQEAIATVLQERIKAKQIELFDQENASISESATWYETLWATMKHGTNAGGAAMELIENKYKNIAATKEEIRLLEELYQKQLQQNNPVEAAATKAKIDTLNENVDSPIKPKKGESAESLAKRRADQLKKEAEDLLKLQRETEDNRLSLIQNAFVREMAINDEAHRRKIEDLQKQASETLSAFDNADGDTVLQSILLKKHDQLLDQIDQSEEQHQAKRNEILQKGVENHIKTIQEQYQREEQEREIAHNNELAALGNNEKAKEALQDQYNEEKLQRQKANELLLIAELEKILDTSKFEGFSLDVLTDEQLKSIQDNLRKLGLSISEINALLAKMSGSEEVDILGTTRGNIDVLGFSVDDWELTFENLDQTKAKMEAVVMTATAMLNAYSMFSEFQANSEKRRIQQMEKNTSLEKDKQARLLENKFISQKQHDDAVRNLDKELEKRKAEIAYKQAKRERTMAIANIAIQTGQAIMGIWAQVPKFDFGISAGILTGIVSALGAVKMAMVATQPLPAKGFESGYYPVRREQDGKMFNAAFGGESRSGVVDKPTVFLAGEGGKNFPEMIIDGRTLKQFNPDLKNSLYRELGRIKGFEGGHYNKDVYQVPAETQDNGYTSLAIALNRNSEILERLEQNGVIAYMSKDLANIKKMRDELERLQKLENKAKINT